MAFVLVLMLWGINLSLKPRLFTSPAQLLFPKGKAMSEYYALQSEQILRETLKENPDLSVRAYERGRWGQKVEVYGKDFPFEIHYEALPPAWKNTLLNLQVSDKNHFTLSKIGGVKIEGQLGSFVPLGKGGVKVAAGDWPLPDKETKYNVILQTPIKAAETWRNKRKLSYGNKITRVVKLEFLDQFPHRGEKMLRSYLDVYSQQKRKNLQDSLLRSLETLEWLLVQSEAQFREQGGIPEFIYPEHHYRNRQEEVIEFLDTKEEQLSSIDKRIVVLNKILNSGFDDQLYKEWDTLSKNFADSSLLTIMVELRMREEGQSPASGPRSISGPDFERKLEVGLIRRKLELEAIKSQFRKDEQIARNSLIDLSSSEAFLWDFKVPGERMKALTWKKYTEQIKEKIRLEEKINNHYTNLNYQVVFEGKSYLADSISHLGQELFLLLFGSATLIFFMCLLVQYFRPRHALPEELSFRTDLNVLAKITDMASSQLQIEKIRANLDILRRKKHFVVAVCGNLPGGTGNVFVEGLREAFHKRGTFCNVQIPEPAEFPEGEIVVPCTEKGVVILLLPPLPDSPEVWDALQEAQLILYLYEVGKTSVQNVKDCNSLAQKFDWPKVETVYIENPVKVF